MRNAAPVFVIAAALAGCWQAAGITLKDLPVRDGSEEAEAEMDDETPDIPDVDLFDPVPDPPADDLSMDDPTVDEIPTGMSAFEYCAGLQDAWCQYIAGCCDGQEQSELSSFIDCNDPAASPFITDCIDRNRLSIETGRMIIDEAVFYETCQPMLTLSTGDCPGIGFFTQMFSELFETYCADVIDGRVPRDGGCAGWLECEEGLCCSSGICTGCAADGMDCTANDQCGAGLRCIGRACAPPNGPGEICDVEDELAVSDCMAGTWCDGDQCSQLLESGQPCPDDNPVTSCKGTCNPEGLCIDFCSINPP